MATFSFLITDESAFEDLGCTPLDWGPSGQSDSWDDLTPSIAVDLGLLDSGICMDISFDASEVLDICTNVADIQGAASDEDISTLNLSVTSLLDVNLTQPTGHSYPDVDKFACNLEELTDISGIDIDSLGVMDTQPVSPSLSFFDHPEEVDPHVPSSCLQAATETKDSFPALMFAANYDSRCNSGYLSQASHGDYEFQERVEYSYCPVTNTTSGSSNAQDLLAAVCMVTDIPHVMPSAAPTQPEAMPSTTTKVMNKKPGEPYIEMIVKALLSVPDKKMILADIYDHIMTRFPYYCTAPKSWRNAVRHCLSVNEFFVKRGRSTNGSGFYWGLHPACISTFQKGDFRRREARMLARQSEKTRQELMSHVSGAVSRFQTISSNKAPLMTSTPSGGHYQKGIYTGSSSGQPTEDMYRSYFASVATSSLSRC